MLATGGLTVNPSDSPGKAKRIIMQVKNGLVSVPQVRDLKGILDREDAQAGLFITIGRSQTQWSRKPFPPESTLPNTTQITATRASRSSISRT